MQGFRRSRKEFSWSRCTVDTSLIKVAIRYIQYIAYTVCRDGRTSWLLSIRLPLLHGTVQSKLQILSPFSGVPFPLTLVTSCSTDYETRIVATVSVIYTVCRPLLSTGMLHTNNSGCGKRDAHINWLMVTLPR